jgi:hypothetical protein
MYNNIFIVTYKIIKIFEEQNQNDLCLEPIEYFILEVAHKSSDIITELWSCDGWLIYSCKIP